MPSFLCQEVVAALAATGIPLALYPDSPLDARAALPEVEEGDALLVVNYFGLRAGPSAAVGGRAAVIEDHTHDPFSRWAATSAADYCVASLRKTLPIPDGGALWSPRRLPLPPAPSVSPERAAASATKLEGMLLKQLYLAGAAVQKDDFRRRALRGEERIASGPVSGMPDFTRALLAALPFTALRERRRRNFELLAGRLEGVPWLRVLRPAGDEAVPFSVVIVTDRPERRDLVRTRLVERRVYPAVLWPLTELPGVPLEHVDLSRRILSLHCDARYDEDDLGRVAEMIESAGKA